MQGDQTRLWSIVPEGPHLVRTRLVLAFNRPLLMTATAKFRMDLCQVRYVSDWMHKRGQVASNDEAKGDAIVHLHVCKCKCEHLAHAYANALPDGMNVMLSLS